MRRLFVLFFLLLGLFACGPRQFVKLHFASFEDTNQGRAIPVYIIPLDDELKQRLRGMKAEDIMVDESIDNMTSLYKLPMQGSSADEILVERKNKRNDFLVVVDYADVTESEYQKVQLESQYYSAKDLYILLEKDRMTLVPKKTFGDKVKGVKQDMGKLKKKLSI